MSDINRVEINIDGIIKTAEKELSISIPKKPMLSIGNYDERRYIGTDDDGSTIYLNGLYFYTENGKYYVNTSNNDLLIMRLTHEIVHVFSNKYGKSGICTGDREKLYFLKNKIHAAYAFDPNEALNEGITQMFTDEVLGKETNRYADVYYEFKKIAQVLKYLFGSEVMKDSYFNHSGSLQRNMNRLSSNIFEIMNKKLTLSHYVSSLMPHGGINAKHNADLKIEKDICKSLKTNAFNECLELIIDNLLIPWIKSKNSEEMKEQIKDFLSIFDDSKTIKNRVMYYLMRGYKKKSPKLPTESSNSDITISHIIGYNNKVKYSISSDGSIVESSTSRIIPYDEQLYEYFYSKVIRDEYWQAIDKAFNNYSLNDNKITISIEGKTITQRRMLLMAFKQYMKKKNIIVLNDVDSLDNGSRFEINYIHEKLTMEDIDYLRHNYTFVCLPGDPLNVLQVFDKKTNREVTSKVLIGKCKIAYKIASLGLASKENQQKWEEFTEIAGKHIANTGMIKRSYEFNNNPFLSLFNDGYGCEWFYEYIYGLPFYKMDVTKQELYLTENEMNNSKLNNEEENEKLASLFTSFTLSDTNQDNNHKRV